MKSGSVRRLVIAISLVVILCLGLNYVLLLLQAEPMDDVKFDMARLHSHGLNLRPCADPGERKVKLSSVSRINAYHGRVNRSVVLTYSDPKTYTGPVIQGWEPHKSRNVTDYLLPGQDTVILDPLQCQPQVDHLDLLIVQHSAPGNLNLRLTNRLTWMSLVKEFNLSSVKMIFVIGVPTIDLEQTDIKLQRSIEQEFANFSDILQVNSVESYGNNTLKSLQSFKYLLGVNWSKVSRDAKPPSYVFRTDDDVYVNVPQLYRTLFANLSTWSSASGNGKLPLLGQLLVGSRVVHLTEREMSLKYAPKNLYQCPSYFFNGSRFYPSYMQGSGYAMPWWSLSCFYQESFMLPYFFIEDVFVGGWLADRCLVHKINLGGITAYRPNKPLAKLDAHSDLLYHYVSSSYKIEAHQIIRKQLLAKSTPSNR